MAWTLVQSFCLSFKDAMKRAWYLVKFRDTIKAGATSFWYRKKDGSIRHAVGIMKGLGFPVKNGKVDYSHFYYYDLESQGIRGFITINLF